MNVSSAGTYVAIYKMKDMESEKKINIEYKMGG